MTMTPQKKRIDTAALLERVDIVKVIDARLHLTKSGAEWEACCPFHTEDTPSFKVSESKQIYHCFGCGANGNAINFLMEYEGLDFKQACRQLGAAIDDIPDAPAGTKTVRRERVKKNEVPDWAPVMPVPEDAPPPPRAHIKRGLPESTWCYRDAAGAVLGYVYRFKTSDGGKEVMPLTWCKRTMDNHCEWRWMHFSIKRPLYGLDALAARPDATVLVVEGEKCKDAGAASLPDLVVVSWPGGGKAVKKADLSPLYGRKVILWPDCDAKREPLTVDEKVAVIDSPRLDALAGRARTALIKELEPDYIDAILDAQAAKPLLPAAEQPGNETMRQVADELLENGSKVWLFEIPQPGEKPDGWDIADAVEEGLTGEALAEHIRAKLRPLAAAIEGVGVLSEDAETTSTPKKAGAATRSKRGYETPEWERGLFYKARGGGLEDCRENAYLILNRHPAWDGVLGFNEFAGRIIKRKPTPTGSEEGEWTDQDDFRASLWLSKNCDLLIKASGTIRAAVSMVADEHRFHPVREYLENLPEWDGIERLDHWLTDCVGVTDGDYAHLVGRFFLLGMVARVYEPGCTMQYMPIFEGPQGKGKSTMLRILGGDWYAETPFKIGDKDAYQQLQGTWLYEIPEMDSFNKAESTAVKAFVTIQTDRYREPYARSTVDRPRQCVFAGNTNHSEYFKDTTGNRRFWPVRCYGTIDLAKIREWRDLLFAEALSKYRAGHKWYPTRDEEINYFKPEQEEREIVDPWLYPMQTWLDEPDRRHKNEFTSTEILEGAFKVSLDKIDGNRGMATRLGNLLARIGWKKYRRTTGRREWIYQRPDDEMVVAENTTGGLDHEPTPF